MHSRYDDYTEERRNSHRLIRWQHRVDREATNTGWPKRNRVIMTWLDLTWRCGHNNTGRGPSRTCCGTVALLLPDTGTPSRCDGRLACIGRVCRLISSVVIRAVARAQSVESQSYRTLAPGHKMWLQHLSAVASNINRHAQPLHWGRQLLQCIRSHCAQIQIHVFSTQGTAVEHPTDWFLQLKALTVSIAITWVLTSCWSSTCLQGH